MPKATFAKTYDHTFASRAMMNFPAGWSGTVKQEVYDGAAAAGALEGVRKTAAPATKAKRGRPARGGTPSSATPAAPAAPITEAPPAGDTLQTNAVSE